MAEIHKDSSTVFHPKRRRRLQDSITPPITKSFNQSRSAENDRSIVITEEMPIAAVVAVALGVVSAEVVVFVEAVAFREPS